METLTPIAPSLEFEALVNKSTCTSEQFSFDQYTCGPGRLRSKALQRHTVFINQGEPLAISYSTDYQWHTVVVGRDATICLLPAGTQVEMKWAQPLNVIAFTFEDSLASAIAHVSSFNFPPRWDITDGLLGEIAKRVSTVTQATCFSERVYVESLATACIEQLAKEYRPAGEEHVRGKLSPQQLSQVIAFAHDCLHSDIGLVDLANLVHLSPYHFGRLFKQTIGLSPYQYLLQLRIEFAKKLIVEGAGPLGDIAYQLNFSDQAHFSNAFRKATGISPRQYSQSHALAQVA